MVLGSVVDPWRSRQVLDARGAPSAKVLCVADKETTGAPAMPAPDMRNPAPTVGTGFQQSTMVGPIQK